MNNIWIGVDTSNYTTSVAAVVSDGTTYNIKRPLCVKPRERGIRQSDAVFMHTKNIPDAFDELMSNINIKYDSYNITAIGVSTRPRPVEGSYMPCFLSGVSVASSIATALKVPLYIFSHQEGHIRAALFSTGLEMPQEFYSFHLSGGTCELLKTKKNGFGFDSKIVSQSLDITLGQLVDRAGVLMGLPFPAGPHMEKIANKSLVSFGIRFKKGVNINVSGFENKVQDMINSKKTDEEIASYVYSVVISSIKHMLTLRKNFDLPVVFGGGVSGSKIVKHYISSICKAYFAESSLASDNALGIALLAKEKYEKELTNV